MPRVALWFFATAPLYVLIGMSLGMYMGASDDHTLYPAHAHLNLIGWVSMALYGTFYALAKNASKKLAWATFWLNNIATVIMFPSLIMVLKFTEKSSFLAPLILSEVLAFSAMACFTLSVWGVLLKTQGQTDNAPLARATPAE